MTTAACIAGVATSFAALSTFPIMKVSGAEAVLTAISRPAPRKDSRAQKRRFIMFRMLLLERLRKLWRSQNPVFNI